MLLWERLDAEMKTAMKAGEPTKVSVIRMVRSEVRNAEIAKGEPLTEEEISEVLAKEAKRRRESIEQFQKGNRSDLVEKETAALQILSQYMPEQLDEEEIVDIAREVISELHATSRSDKGRVMSAVIQRVRGKADGRLVSQVVDRLLESNSA